MRPEAAAVILLLGMPLVLFAEIDAAGPPSSPGKNGIRTTDVANPFTYNRTHRKSNVWLTITNWGYIGNNSPGRSDAMEDPEYPGTWAPQCEFPGGSDIQYLFMGALWIGALVQEEGYEFPRVSEGSEGWTSPLIHEFYPGEGAANGIEERSTRPNEWNRLGDYITHPDAISEQDFICSYADTLTDPTWVRSDPVDGSHFPLGLEVRHRSYSWTYNYAQDFILIDYEIENIAGNYLKNLYVGLYVDSDVGRIDETNWHTDDICGFQEYYSFTRPGGIQDSVRINIAYISDNDGRPPPVSSGSDFYSPGVSGTRVVRAPNPRLITTFNWWISNMNPDLDFGPAWEDDGSGGWTYTYGTPMGDERKYFVMSNREFDYDQIHVNNGTWIGNNPQYLDYYDGKGDHIIEDHAWKIEENLANADDLADGYDTRYLISWGPLGIFDHTDEAGNDIFRLNPGERFNMSLAYVCGDNFHDRNNPQTTSQTIDPDKFDFADLKYNAAWAAWVYDNPMRDTPCFDWGNDHDPDVTDEDGSQGDGIYDTGDGWYGEDTGLDGLFALLPPGTDSLEVVYFGQSQGWYTEPDSGELDGMLQPEEDDWYLPTNWVPPDPYGQYIEEELFESIQFGTLDLGYMRGNRILDAGDGIPDFQGPQPPPVPNLGGGMPTETNGVFTTETEVMLRWTPDPTESETYQDNFSHIQDFEGYRIYVSNTGLENDFALVQEFDRIDFAYFSATDSMVTYPDTRTDAPADTVIGDSVYTRKPVGGNVGFAEILDENGNYVFEFNDVHPLFPRWYSVTAYDFGDPKSGTEPLETARSANAQYVAPSGNPNKEILVVPNPYRAYLDYTQVYSGGLQWENQDDGTPEFFPNTDRRLDFINLPDSCLIRIFTVAGDLVAVVPHNIIGDTNIGWESDFSESWDLNSRNNQQVCSGLYLFSVEYYTSKDKGKIQTGKFVIIR